MHELGHNLAFAHVNFTERHNIDYEPFPVCFCDSLLGLGLGTDGICLEINGWWT